MIMARTLISPAVAVLPGAVERAGRPVSPSRSVFLLLSGPSLRRGSHMASALFSSVPVSHVMRMYIWKPVPRIICSYTGLGSSFGSVVSFFVSMSHRLFFCLTSDTLTSPKN